MIRDPRRDPRHLPHPEELKKTNEPLDQGSEEIPLEGAAIKQQVVYSTGRYSDHRRQTK